MSTSSRRQTAAALAALDALPSDELRARKLKAALASAESRRQSRDETITVKIVPAHKLSASQLVAWRRLWALLLAPIEETAAGE